MTGLDESPIAASISCVRHCDADNCRQEVGISCGERAEHVKLAHGGGETKLHAHDAAERGFGLIANQPVDTLHQARHAMIGTAFTQQLG